MKRSNMLPDGMYSQDYKRYCAAASTAENVIAVIASVVLAAFIVFTMIMIG